MDGAKRLIRTPDQRIRVFVSSTLKELEPERRAVRAAIEQLGLAPVMFELGARPHPPRELYRSYLAQSDIFVGIYADSYGWVAPGEEISGLEDEYRLSAGLPGLIYLRESEERSDRLNDLLDRIRADDRSSYKSFATPDELAQLLRNDLATLLADRFDSGDAGSATGRAPGIPAPYTRLIGREREKRELHALLDSPGVRIVTIVGTGGIGKSRLAIELAGEAAATGREVGFALLESITHPERVISAVARALGVRDAAVEGSLVDKVVAAIGDRRVLLVVDNMEHLLDAAPMLVRLVTDCPRLQLLVTSRSPLRVRAERVYALGALDLPSHQGEDDAGSSGRRVDVTEASRSSAVALFIERAVAVRADFRLTPENAEAVVALCRALDGVPLAIELAAARMRTLTPADVLARLDSSLAILVSGARDLPARQRALRDTIRWSVELLDVDAQRALSALSVFAGSFTFDAAEAVLTAIEVDDVLTGVEALVDASLLARVDGATPTFRLLSSVRAYGEEQASAEDRERAVQAWIGHYAAVADDAAIGLRGPDQLHWLARLELESENFARVARTLLDSDRLDDAATFLWALYLHLWIGGYLGIVEAMAEELLERSRVAGIELAPRSRAIALYYRNAVKFWQDPRHDSIPGMRESRDLFHDVGDSAGSALAGVSLALALLAQRDGPDLPGATQTLEQSLSRFAGVEDTWGEAMTLVTLGRVDLLAEHVDAARRRFDDSYALAVEQGERLGIVIALNHRGWAKVLGGDPDGGRDDFARSLDMSLALGHDEGVAYGLEGFVGLAAFAGDARRAGRLLGAAQNLRRRKGMLNPGAFELYMIPVAALRGKGLGDELDAAIARGHEMTVAEALEDVRD